MKAKGKDLSASAAAGGILRWADIKGAELGTVGTPHLLLRAGVWALVHRYGGRDALEPLRQMYWEQTGYLHLTTPEGKTHTVGGEVLELYVWSYLSTLVPPTDYSLPTHAAIMGKEILTWAMALQSVEAERIETTQITVPVKDSPPTPPGDTTPDIATISPLRQRMKGIPDIVINEPKRVDEVYEWMFNKSYVDAKGKYIGGERKKVVCRGVWEVIKRYNIATLGVQTASELRKQLNAVFDGLEVSERTCVKNYNNSTREDAEDSLSTYLKIK